MNLIVKCYFITLLTTLLLKKTTKIKTVKHESIMQSFKTFLLI